MPPIIIGRLFHYERLDIVTSTRAMTRIQMKSETVGRVDHLDGGQGENARTKLQCRLYRFDQVYAASQERQS